jgi:hypothetical protein
MIQDASGIKGRAPLLRSLPIQLKIAKGGLVSSSLTTVGSN